MARGISIPKPNKPSYELAKSYRTIPLLSCLGKAVERVVTELLSRHCETSGTLHEGSSERDERGRRLRRSERWSGGWRELEKEGDYGCYLYGRGGSLP